MERERDSSPTPKSPTPLSPSPFPSSANLPAATANRSPRLPSPLNPNPSHGHSASFSGPSASYRNSLLSSPPNTSTQALPPNSNLLGSPFQPGSSAKARGRGHSISTVPVHQSEMAGMSPSILQSSPNLTASPPTQTSPSMPHSPHSLIHPPPLLSPSTTIRPDNVNNFADYSLVQGGTGTEAGAGTGTGPSLSSSFRTRSRGSSRNRERSVSKSPASGSKNVSLAPEENGVSSATVTGISSSRSLSFARRQSRPWHTMSLFASGDAKDSGDEKQRRHSVATIMPTTGAGSSVKDSKTGKESKDTKEGDHHATVPSEQMENWDITRKRVAQAASSILGTSALIAHEVLLDSVELLELAPVPGLQAAARTLLQIWDSLQEVDSNRLQCLRLTERCADILLSVRQEVYEAGDQVAEELKLPIDKLTESFTDVHALLAKQASRPFLKRYLKRDEISKQIQQCDVSLQEALGMFSLSIQIRILKQVQLAEARRQHDTEELLKNVVNLGHMNLEHYQQIQSQRLPPPPSYQNQLSFPQTQTPPSPFPYSTSAILPTATTLSAANAISNPAMLSGSLLLSSGSPRGSVSALPAPSTQRQASASTQSLIPGLQGLPASSSHSSLSQSLTSVQWPSLPSLPISPAVQSLSPTQTNTNVVTPVPSVSITPSSRPSTASNDSDRSNETTPKQGRQPLPQPVQLIPTKSTIEVGAPALDALKSEAMVATGDDSVIAASADLSSISAATGTVPSISAVPSGAADALPTAIPPALLPSPSTLPPSLVLPTLLSLTQYQNALDAESDYVDLRGIMRAALSKGTDVEMMRVLGVGLRGKSGLNDGVLEGGGIGGGGLDAGEVVEAIKTLQRAHEAILERERWEAAVREKQEDAGGLGLGDDGAGLEGARYEENVGGTKDGKRPGGRPGFYRRTSSSSAKALARIKRRMSLQSQSSNSFTAATGTAPISAEPSVTTPLNETVIDEEEGDVEEEAAKKADGTKMKKSTSRTSTGGKLLRSKTMSSSSTSSTTKTNDSMLSQAGSGSGSGKSRASGGAWEGAKESPDTLDKEFIESGIDALRRMSKSTMTRTDKGGKESGDAGSVLPSWTITRFEIEGEEKIGIGFFSDVYKGTWRPPSVPSAPPYPPSAAHQSPSYIHSPPSRTVAIKILAETTPRSLFLRETAIWKTLAHPNVLELYGASSAFGDPPWFFVSPYLKNGSLAEFLRKNAMPDPVSGKTKIPTGLVLPGNSGYEKYVETVGGAGGTGTGTGPGGRSRTGSLSGYPGWNGGGLGSLVGAHAVYPLSSDINDSGLGLGASAAHPYGTSDSAHTRGRSGSGSTIGVSGAGLGLGEVPKEWDLLRFMHEIAKGMEYLHSRGILHGDLKAANVLVDDKIHCVIADFGQSEMRSEAYRISGTAPPHGTLRWQAPELMAGSTQLTVEMDVYAFAICCTEVLSLGRMPWPFYNDEQVQHQISLNQRPVVPVTCFTTPDLTNLIQTCWATNPFYRPPFSKVASELKALRRGMGGAGTSGGTERGMDLDLRSPQLPEWQEYEYQHHRLPSFPSPDLHPIPIPLHPRDQLMNTRNIHTEVNGTPSSPYSNSYSSEDASFRTARETSISPPDVTHRETALTASASTDTAITITPYISTSLSRSGSPFTPQGALPFSPTSSVPFSPTASPLLPSSHSSPFIVHHGSDVGHTPLNYGGSPSAGQPGRLQQPETVVYMHSRPPSSRASSIFTSTPSESQSEEGYHDIYGRGSGSKPAEYDGYDSPPPANDLIAEARNERRYRLLLVHEFHPSLTLPLWKPTPIALGAVGYLSKPKGEFITLINAFHTQKSTNTLANGLPSVHGYGKITTGSQRQDKRNAAQRGLDALAGLLTKSRAGSVSQSVSRRYSFPLRAGHKTAYLCTETTMYRYVENLDAPKKWFKANADKILEIFTPQHHIQKEDLFLVIGTLDTPEHALFVSHNHPDGQVQFNVFTSSKSDQPWGMFTIDTETPFELGGPSYHEPVSGSPLSASKISTQSNYPWNTVAVARLRFKPDVPEPTSL